MIPRPAVCSSWLQVRRFGWKYLPSRLLGMVLRATDHRDIPICFVTHEGTRGWILDTICRELAAFSGLPSVVHYTRSFNDLPRAQCYFFAHQNYFAKALSRSPRLWKRPSLVFFTHEKWGRFYTEDHVYSILGHARQVICMNSSARDAFLDRGFSPEAVTVWHAGADPDRFTAHCRGSGIVGFCGACYERKNPRLIHEIVRTMTDTPFILVGKDWDRYPHWEQLRSLPNFSYHDVDYSEYPALYRKMDVLVSASLVEGGPVPVLEAMMSNVVPVVTNVGWCPDLIEHGKNGFLFDPAVDAQDVAELIRTALNFKGNIRETVVCHSWKSYGRRIAELVTKGNYSGPPPPKKE